MPAWTLTGWLLRIGGIIALIALIVFFFGGPIIGFYRTQAAKWEGRAETATDTKVSAEAENKAQGRLVIAQGKITERVIERNNTIVEYREKAGAAPDAKAPLGDAADRRIRDHDAWLCEQRPTLRGCGAGPAGDDTGIREKAL